MNNRTVIQTLLLIVGAVVLLGGLVCVVAGFVSFAGSDPADPSSEGSAALALFAAGGFAMVVGFGIVAFTRAAIVSGSGGYTRITVEQGRAPRAGRSCSTCGRPLSASARFCESCGAAVG